MRVKFLVLTASITSVAIASAVLAQSPSDSGAPSRPRYLPEYTADGELVLPKNFHEWVYVGSPLTPNALNDGHAGFPEYHNVYIEPGSRRMNSPKGQSCSRSCNSRCRGRTPMVREPSHRGG